MTAAGSTQTHGGFCQHGNVRHTCCDQQRRCLTDDSDPAAPPVSPEHNDLLLQALPPLVLLQADVAVVLPRVQPPGDGSTQVCQGPVEVMVQQAGGGFQESL